MLSTQVFSQRKDILVVDDAPENLRILLNALTERGHTVRCAKSGNLAIAGSQAMPPDLVLLDILMPQMDGYEVCQRLKQDIRTSDIPVIFLSALDDGNDKVKAFTCGANDYIAKPFNIDEVLARVDHQLKQRYRYSLLRQRADKYRQASHEFRNAYSFLVQVLDSLTDGVAAFEAVRNPQGDITDLRPAVTNEAFLRLLEKVENAPELTSTLRRITDQHGNPELYALCLQAVENHGSIQRELSCYEGDRQLWLEVFATKLQDGVVTSLREISGTKQQIAALESTKHELYELATTDVLTQLGNRYQFDFYFEQEWQRSLREQKTLSLLMADIDQFKRFNDICGHTVGDACLRAVAQTLKSVIKRPADLVARYGGEEFAIVLPNTPLKGAIQIAYSIQSAIRKLRLPDVPDPRCERVRLSIGISCATPQSQQPPLTLIDAADKALYSAKALGGDTNCVETI